MLRRYATALLAAALLVPMLALSPAGAQSGGSVFVAVLSGDQEVPPVDTDATGIAAFTVSDDGSSMDYVLVTNGLTDITASHIHLGAAGANGGVSVTLLGGNAEGITTDGLLATGTITDADVDSATLADLLADMAAGDTYVNVHTGAVPSGEIRGQIAELTITDAFTDDNGNFHEDSINAIAAAGITLGAGNGLYDPSSNVPRRQMATFLTRAFNLPMTTTDYFVDDDGLEAEPYINAIAAAGITLGCDTDRFCPSEDVTRGQMASFIMRALGVSAAPNGDFFDDAAGVHEANINGLAALGITAGIDANSFGAMDPISRDQMATFLARTHKLAPRENPLFALTILHNNDGESDLVADGDVGGAARFKAVVDQQKSLGNAQTDGVLMLSSGDNFLAGTAFEASLSDGTFYDVLALEAIGYDAIQLGNHDFDFGPDTLADFISAFTDAPPYLSSNLDFSGEANLAALVDPAGPIAPSTSVDIGGRTIGIVGATTPNLPFISSPRDVVVDSDVTGAVQGEFDTLAAGGADILIMISHLQGIDEDIALGPDLDGLDVMIAGGGDELLANADDALLPDDAPEDIFGAYPLTTTNSGGADVPVVTTSGQYGYLGKLVVWFDTDGNVVDSDGGPIAINGQSQDADLLTTVEEPVADFQSGLAANVIATSEVQLDGVRDNVRSMETNEGNLIADAMLWQANELAASFSVGEADVALQNGGGIRNDDLRPDSAPGDITELDTFDMLPFGNLLVIVPDVSRDNFKEILENAVSALNSDGSLGSEGTGRFAQIAGFSFTWDGDGTAQVIDEDGNITTPGTRVTDVALDDGTDIVIGGVVQAGCGSEHRHRQLLGERRGSVPVRRRRVHQPGRHRPAGAGGLHPGRRSRWWPGRHHRSSRLPGGWRRPDHRTLNQPKRLLSEGVDQLVHPLVTYSVSATVAASLQPLRHSPWRCGSQTIG